MKILRIRDKELENQDIKDHSLSILITQNGLSYFIFSINENRFYSLVSQDFSQNENILQQIKNFILSEKLSENNFNKVKVYIANVRNTIVPEALFDKEKAEDFFKLNYIKDNNESILFSHLPKTENYIIYSINTELKDLLENCFNKVEFFSHALPFIELNYTKNKIADNPNIPKIYIQVFENFFDVLLIQDSSLRLYNTFTYKTNNDLLYFIINIFEQLKIPQNESELIISGLIETDNIAVLNLRKFVKSVYFSAQNPDYKYYYKFQEIAPHYFVNYLNNY